MRCISRLFWLCGCLLGSCATPTQPGTVDLIHGVGSDGGGASDARLTSDAATISDAATPSDATVRPDLARPADLSAPLPDLTFLADLTPAPPDLMPPPPDLTPVCDANDCQAACVVTCFIQMKFPIGQCQNNQCTCICL